MSNDTKYIVYYRVSTKKQNSEMITQTAVIEHYIPQDKVVKTYKEVASAKSIDGRPILQQAIQDCIDNGYTLAVAKVDRLSRKTEDALEIYSRLDGRLICCDIPNLDKFTLTIFMAIADRERELISIRTKQALAQKKKQGVKLGNPERLTSEGRELGVQSLIENAKEAYSEDENYVCMMRKSGMSYRAIAAQLNSDGKKTRNGKPFKAMTVKRMLDRVG